MMKRNIGIIAIIILIIVAFLDYDDGNKNKRFAIYNKALSIRDAIQKQEELLEKGSRLLGQVDLVLAKLTSSKEMNDEEQQIYNTAIRYRDNINVKLEEIKSKGEKLIDEYNNFVEEYNRTTRPILFRERELPAKMVRYEKPNLPHSSGQKI